MTFRLLNRAATIDGRSRTRCSIFDVGSQNFVVRRHRPATSALLHRRRGAAARGPAGRHRLNGAPPWFMRDGQGGNEWLRQENPSPNDGSGWACAAVRRDAAGDRAAGRLRRQRQQRPGRR
ncbi:MAG: hypothetical protein MZW92_74860 [Comamonadaceae bacterium]|nr:hypothetical protein [Comamonadaceae bacterium]